MNEEAIQHRFSLRSDIVIAFSLINIREQQLYSCIQNYNFHKDHIESFLWNFLFFNQGINIVSESTTFS